MSSLRKTYVVASSKPWHKSLVKKIESLGEFTVFWVDNPRDLSLEILHSIEPQQIFFPHWSWIIPEKIFESYECIIFHMTDLPFGRGGSPLQNLIANKIYETKVSALRCVKELDAGPVYLNKPLSLYGAAEEIYLRAGKLIEDMVEQIILEPLEPKVQKGGAVTFGRRCPEQSRLDSEASLSDVFDKIRMLDASGYPLAFIEQNGFKFEFSRASLKHGQVLSDVRITKIVEE